MLRLCGAELVEVPAVALQQSQQLPAHRAGGSPSNCARREPNGVLFADQWNNLDNRKAHYRLDRPGNLAADRRQGRRLHLRRRHRRDTRRHGELSAREEARHRHRLSPIRRGAAMYNSVRHGEAKARRAARSPKASAWAASPRSSKTSRWTSPIRSPTRRRCRSSSTCWSTRGCAWAARPASMSRARSGSPRTWAPATPSSPCCATTARAISPSCSTRNSCARRSCRCRPGSSGVPTVDDSVRKGLMLSLELKVVGLMRGESPAIREDPAMPTDCLFREDSYLKNAAPPWSPSTDAGGIVLDRTVFYAASGGQPADRGVLTTATGDAIPIANVVFTDPGKTEIAHVPTRREHQPSPSANRCRPRSTGRCATPACACTPRCICFRRCCPIR